MIISMVPFEEVANIWPEVSGFIEKSIEKFPARYSIVDVYEEILLHKQSLWVAYDDEYLAAWTVRIAEYPQGRILNIDWIGGKEPERWDVEAMTIMERYAKDMGCKRISSFGRPGWKNRGKACGFAVVSYVFEKEVE